MINHLFLFESLCYTLIGDNMKKTIIILIACLFVLTGCKSSNKELKVKLESDPYSGYIWEYTVSDQGIVKVSEDNDYSCDENKEKCSGNQIFLIEPLSSGKVVVDFLYYKGYNTLYEAKYEIEVTDDLEIEEIHYGSYFKR